VVRAVLADLQPRVTHAGLIICYICMEAVRRASLYRIKLLSDTEEDAEVADVVVRGALVDLVVWRAAWRP